jgi:DNA-binding NarL/FixJ family response regulator
MSDKMYRIGIIEDDDSLRNNYSEYFDITDGFELAFAFASAEEFARRFREDKENPVDIILLDIRLPGKSGVDTIPTIKEKSSGSAVIMLTALIDKKSVVESFMKGADGFLTKDLSMNEIRESILNRSYDYPLISPEATKMIINNLVESRERVEQVRSKLTRREFEVAVEIAKGLSYKEIADVLSISTGTVNQHLKSVYVKLGIESRAQLSFLMNR